MVQAISPPRMTITNIATNETFTAQFNPPTFDEEVQANWSKLTVPGLSHQPLQFSHTGNEAFTFSLFWRATSSAELNQMRSDRRFLKSLCFPQGSAETVAGGAPPRVLLVWPRMLSLTAVVSAVRLSHEEFNRYAQARVTRGTVQIEEIRDVRITSEDVRGDTELRYGNSPGTDLPGTANNRPSGIRIVRV